MDIDTNIANSHGDKQHSRKDDVGGDKNDLNPSKLLLLAHRADRKARRKASSQVGREVGRFGRRLAGKQASWQAQMT